MKHFVLHTILFLMIVTVAGCQDDFLKQEIIGEGKASVSATLDFKPMSAALTQTRATGGALKDIRSLHVLLYDQNRILKKQWRIEQYKVSDENRTDTDAENGHKAETQTKRATFKLPEEISFGKYYMYAVANIPDLLTNTAYSEAIKTVDGLKNIPLTWDFKDVANNGQMIGFFTKKTASALSTNDESLVVNEKSVKLHAWLRRAASKVTIAYDGSDLAEGVFIYLESVQIKDIPLQCYLGKDNNVGAEGYKLEVEAPKVEAPKEGKEIDMPDGEIISYSNHKHGEAGFEIGDDCVGHRITAGSPKFGSHEETDEALYFYENMQGAGDDMPDKQQDATGPDGKPDGKLDFPGLPDDETYRLKDGVPYGTYIEVKAHYISNNSKRLGNGPIIYRFMLGQDEKNDYNAKRNCHYKLTLKFRNFANDADWHIEYEEPEPGVMTPEPYYITYLYNHSMMYPIKVNTGGHKIESIKAEIKENNWAPHNDSSDIYYTGAPNGVAAPWNGFLSLHKTTETVLYADKITNNETYYQKDPKRGERVYKNFTLPDNQTFEEFTTDGSVADDKYRIEKHPTEANTYNVYIPMYTRAKQMISTTGYTGNNPYVAYQRKAIVRITTKLTGVDKPFINEVPIYQVRRVVNPKGIYRSANNNKSFHVVLKRLPGEDERMFKTFQSEGPWKAYVIKRSNGDGITLSATSGSESKPDSEYGFAIHGKTGSVIDFNVDFSGSSTENRYAIIRVEYHNYTCQHLIFVRQGDKPDDLVTGGVKWYAKNMRTSTELASTPLDEGSLFKFGNWLQPIDALSNKNPFEPWINVTPENFKVYPENGFTNAATKNEMKWDSITSNGNAQTFGNPQMQKARVATADDFWELRKEGSHVEQGYGVLYGDDATKTADDIVEVYGYDYEHNTMGRGMRGCFAYNSETGKSLFFPIGASGYGHRKQSFNTGWGDHESLNGVLRYASGRTKLYEAPTERPLFYDLYKRPGAIYWLNKEIPRNQLTPTDGSSLGWDINYFSFDFNFISTSNLIRENGSDACFVRCVVDE